MTTNSDLERGSQQQNPEKGWVEKVMGQMQSLFSILKIFSRDADAPIPTSDPTVRKAVKTMRATRISGQDSRISGQDGGFDRHVHIRKSPHGKLPG